VIVEKVMRWVISSLFVSDNNFSRRSYTYSLVYTFITMHFIIKANFFSVLST
jgi:hypothetical protein